MLRVACHWLLLMCDPFRLLRFEDPDVRVGYLRWCLTGWFDFSVRFATCRWGTRCSVLGVRVDVDTITCTRLYEGTVGLSEILR